MSGERLQDHWSPGMIKEANSKGADQTVRMRRLICALLFAYGENGFSHDMAEIMSVTTANL